MRICVIGAGIAGALLTWRLCLADHATHVDLVGGTPAADATSISGGSVRSYEPDPRARRNAADSMAELRASHTLRDWARYRDVGSTYLRPIWPDADAELAAIDATVPGSARLCDAMELRRLGWSGLAADVVGVLEREAGYIDPAALRAALLTELSRLNQVRFLSVPATPLGAADGRPRCRIGADIREYDRVVVAAGAWTPALLADGLGGECATAYRVKGIQYALHPAAGALPTPFVDDTTGLFGRPVDQHTMLIGVPVTEYGGPPAGAAPDLALATTAERLAAVRLPGMRLGPAHTLRRSADCYGQPATLLLRIVDGHDGVFTFTAGSGGSAKTALAASRHAANQLIAGPVAPRPRTEAHTPGASAVSTNTLYERVDS